MRSIIELVESGAVPDVGLRWAIRRLHSKRLRQQESLEAGDAEAACDAWARTLRSAPIAPVPEKANEQHYELPPDFFRLVLGERMKYSACHWPPGVTTLEQAEDAMLALSCERAEMRDGLRVLDMGCGWGSLTLWLLERYPTCRVVAVSNSVPQRHFIEAELARRGLATRAEIVTADLNHFEPSSRFDRVMSIEMMEHARNWGALLSRAARWLEPDGKMFVHVFSHRIHAYPFEDLGQDDWMGRYFFSGGQMPSHGLMSRFQDDLVIEESFRESGHGYARTSEAWLDRLDARRDEARAVLARRYGADEAGAWLQRWRIFFMACAELFAMGDGNEWGVSHYRLAPRAVESRRSA
jgi:cyclopropane-fatty-acyl-phospholipid synthase